ncbi:MAG: hypothetical protein WA172_02395 [Terriglobales bacterium]
MSLESESGQENSITPSASGESQTQTNQGRPDMPIRPSIPATPPTKPHYEITCKTEKTFWDKFKDGAEIIGICLLAVYTWYSVKMYCANRDAADAATSAANTAAKQLELTARPWVDLDISITTPVTYDRDGLHISFTFIPKNIGPSPAQNVSIAPKLIPGSMGTDVHEIQKRICDNRAVASDEPLRYALFPNRSYEQKITMQITDAEINSQWSKFELSQGPNDLLPVLLVGCVDYTYDSSPRHHQTGFAFDVLMKDGRILLKSKMPLQPNSVGLMEHSFGGHFAN